LSTKRALLRRDRRIEFSQSVRARAGNKLLSAARWGLRSRPRRLALPLSAALLAFPGVAAAADTTINFDNLASGTTVSNQYAPQGVTFDQSPSGPATLMPFIQSDPAGAHSSPNVLNINQGGCGAEVTRHELWGQFAASRNHVNLFVGDLNTAAAEQVTLTGYDLSGTAIPTATQTVTLSGGSGVHTAMSITDPSSQISFFDVLGSSSARCLAIDDFSFDALPSAIAPDFGLSTLATSDTVVAGSSTSVPLLLHRTSTSTGAISLAVTGLPQGVTPSFSGAGVSGNQTTGGDGSQITLTLSAAAGAPPAVNAPVTITGTPSAGAGSVPRSTTIDLSVTGNFELRTQGIDVTQGVVNDGILLPSGDGSGANYQGLTWAPIDCCNDPLPSTSPNSSLVQGNRTIARVYADAHGAPPGGVPGVGAVLHGYRNGAELPGSPLLPDYGPGSLPDTGEPDPAIVGPAERKSDANAFTFTLPSAWTQGTISLTADVIPPYPTFGGPQYVPCSDPSCQAHLSFTLNNIPFITLPWVVIAPLKEGMPGDPAVPSSAVPLYQRALLTEPAANQFAVLPYVGTVDPTPEVKNDDDANTKPFTVTKTNPCPGAGYLCNRDHNTDYRQAINDWGTQNLTGNSMLSQPALPADILAGVNGAQRGQTTASIYNEPFSNPASGGSPAQATTLVDIFRPITSVAHETGHALGRNHADDSTAAGQLDGSGSSGCGGGGGPWPPDGLGDLQGIGLDTSVHPYKLIADGLTGEPAQWYDLMSYCGGANENQHWISPFGWLHSISALSLFGQRTGRGPNLQVPYSGYQGIEAAARYGAVRARTTAAASAGLEVTATVRPGGSTQIDSVIPTTTQLRGLANSPFELVARGSAGQTVANVPMEVLHVHDDPGLTFLMVQATVPRGGVDSVQISSGGTVVASRTRSAQLPSLRILAPARKAVVGRGRGVTVRWSTRAAPGAVLDVAISYSKDNGRHWRGIYLGPNRGSVRLPSTYFSGSGGARIRIAVNDGFNQVQAISARFRAVGTPPTVSILEPARAQTFGGEASIYLHGQAFDDALVPLQGRHLRWLVDGTTLGTGVTVTAVVLPPGADRITLLATDPRGRSASASLTIHVSAVRLPFLRLRVPARIGTRARRLTIRASSALVTTLRLGRRNLTLGTAAKVITLKVAPGRRPLLLRLEVSARGVTYPVTLVVRR
jgi:hypothetical protein